MPNPERTATTESGVNLLLPEGLSPTASQELGRRLVDALAADPATARALPSGARRMALAGESEAAAPEGVSTLNRFIGVLTVPMAPGANLDAVRNAIRGVPGADGVRVEPVKRFGIPPGEEPG